MTASARVPLRLGSALPALGSTAGPTSSRLGCTRPLSIAVQRKQVATLEELSTIPSWRLSHTPPSRTPIYSLPSGCSASPTSPSPTPPSRSDGDGPPTSISRHLSFNTFSAAFGFITRVGLLAARLSHHPEWSNSGGKVTIRLTTDDVGGVVTALDVRMAKAIDKAASECGELGQAGANEE